jgi:hypothetical protein
MSDFHRQSEFETIVNAVQANFVQEIKTIKLKNTRTYKDKMADIYQKTRNKDDNDTEKYN